MLPFVTVCGCLWWFVFLILVRLLSTHGILAASHIGNNLIKVIVYFFYVRKVNPDFKTQASFKYYGFCLQPCFVDFLKSDMMPYKVLAHLCLTQGQNNFLSKLLNPKSLSPIMFCQIKY